MSFGRSAGPPCQILDGEEAELRGKSSLPERRQERAWSQQRLSDELGISRQTAISIECSRFDPSLPLDFRPAALFGCSIDELFEPPRGRIGRRNRETESLNIRLHYFLVLVRLTSQPQGQKLTSFRFHCRAFELDLGARIMGRVAHAGQAESMGESILWRAYALNIAARFQLS